MHRCGATASVLQGTVDLPVHWKVKRKRGKRAHR
jgi:hypothetical protein